MKMALVAYEDGDTENRNGPINSEIFSGCWKRVGSPRDFFDLAAGVGKTQMITVGVPYAADKFNSFRGTGLTLKRNFAPTASGRYFGFADLATEVRHLKHIPVGGMDTYGYASLAARREGNDERSRKRRWLLRHCQGSKYNGRPGCLTISIRFSLMPSGFPSAALNFGSTSANITQHRLANWKSSNISISLLLQPKLGRYSMF